MQALGGTRGPWRLKKEAIRRKGLGMEKRLKLVKWALSILVVLVAIAVFWFCGYNRSAREHITEATYFNGAVTTTYVCKFWRERGSEKAITTCTVTLNEVGNYVVELGSLDGANFVPKQVWNTDGGRLSKKIWVGQMEQDSNLRISNRKETLLLTTPRPPEVRNALFDLLGWN
jgi:hypothetical protein